MSSRAVRRPSTIEHPFASAHNHQSRAETRSLPLPSTPHRGTQWPRPRDDDATFVACADTVLAAEFAARSASSPMVSWSVLGSSVTSLALTSTTRRSAASTVIAVSPAPPCRTVMVRSSRSTSTTWSAMLGATAVSTGPEIRTAGCTAVDSVTSSPHVSFHFTPKGSSWINQIETWFSIITRQSIRRGTFSSVKVLITQIREYIAHWNTTAKPFAWTATADEILAKVRLVQANVKKLVDNNAKS